MRGTKTVYQKLSRLCQKGVGRTLEGAFPLGSCTVLGGRFGSDSRANDREVEPNGEVLWDLIARFSLRVASDTLRR